MGWRFRKSVKLLPGVRLNISKSGLSTTLGGAPMSVNIGPKGVRRTVSIPGTGISNVQMISGAGGSADDGDGDGAPQRRGNGSGCVLIAVGLGVIPLLAMCGGNGGKTLPPAPLPVASEVAMLQPDPRPHYVTKGANCRRAPSIETTVMDRFPAGKQIEVGIPVSGFYPTKTHDGLTCFISTKLVSDKPSANPARKARRRPASQAYQEPTYVAEASCPCSGYRDCIGPRGGHYCYTRGGNKRYR